jgi:RNA polymerase sigma-54 factor
MAFAEQAAPAIFPDLAVEKNDDGQYVVRILDGRSQRLSINDYYRDISKKKETDKGTRDYIKKNIGSSQWLIEAIEQRRATLTKVGPAIVDHQIDFFELGPHALKPLKMQPIADLVGVHVTTISRACDEKWLLTSQGIYPLKRFFSGAIAASDGGDTVAQDAVMLKLRDIIDKEDKSKPFSDDELVRELSEAGIKIARRTVVKYRQVMKIPSSRERRAWN